MPSVRRLPIRRQQPHRLLSWSANGQSDLTLMSETVVSMQF
jgi:hypothetical protein